MNLGSANKRISNVSSFPTVALDCPWSLILPHQGDTTGVKVEIQIL